MKLQRALANEITGQRQLLESTLLAKVQLIAGIAVGGNIDVCVIRFFSAESGYLVGAEIVVKEVPGICLRAGTGSLVQLEVVGVHEVIALSLRTFPLDNQICSA